MISTVFVSSTFVDLQTYRKAVWEALQDFDVNIRGMEQFGARTETPLQTCIAEVDQSDIYVGVIGFRLGSIEPTSGKSYTQLEYERALTLSKEIFIYMIDEQNARVPRRFIDSGETLDKLDAFKSILRERHTIDTFVDEGDLVAKLRRDLRRYAQVLVETTSAEDESRLALARLQQFAILPKTVAGSEVRVMLRLEGPFYPASKAVCNAFNLEFGATAGVKIDIVSPANSGITEVPHLLVPAKLLVSHLPLVKGDELDCYVRLHFASERADSVRARYSDRYDYPDSKFAGDFSIFGKPVITPADSQLAFEVARIVRISQISGAS